MKKRIPALVMCLIMIATMLIACGDDYYDMAKDYIGNNELKPAKPNVTLNMYIPCNGEIDDITLSSMQAEFNYVTETKYQTRVVFHMIPVAEYQQAVRDQASFAAQHIEDELDKTPASINDKYPKENDIQFDIFVSLGKSMLDGMISSGLVSDLTTEMTKTYNQKLFNLNDKTSVSDIIYTSATWSDSDDNPIYYGVPSNYLIGQYTYYLIDKEKADVHYFSIPSEKKGVEACVTELLTNIDKNDTISDKAAYKNEAVQTFTGDYRARYEVDTEKYYIYVKSTPTVDTTRLYEGMFCIANTCRYKDRAMQVIAELYTNVALHTTLQYGVKNLTYKLVEKDGMTLVELIDGAPAYSINPKYTGNIAKLYICPEAGYDLTFIEDLYIQNKEAILP